MSANFRHLFQCGGVIQDRLTKFKPILHAPARDYVVDGGKGEAVMGQVAVLHPFIVRKQASKVNKTLDQYPLVWYNYLCRFFGATFLIGIRVKPRLLGRGRIARAPQASLF